MYYFYTLKVFFSFSYFFCPHYSIRKRRNMDGSFKCRERHKQCTMELCIDFLLCGAGVVFTVSLKFVQVSKFKESFKKAFGGMSLKGKKQVKME